MTMDTYLGPDDAYDGSGRIKFSLFGWALSRFTKKLNKRLRLILSWSCLEVE